MSKKPESRLQLKIQKKLRKQFTDCYVRKIHGNEFQHSGIADLICCVRGLFIALEVKVNGHGAHTLPSELQLQEAKEVIRAGGSSFFVHSPEEAIAAVRSVLRRHGLLVR